MLPNGRPPRWLVLLDEVPRHVGRYELLRPIASGGMARVYLGRVAADVAGFERLVAIKVMHSHLADSTDAVAMFMDEARLAARIRHPNVVATLDIVQEAAAPFLVMEFIEGPSLHRILRLMHRRKERMPLDVTARIFADTLTGLHAAHELRGADGAPMNLVHRDVSPQNVLVGCDGVSRITDFGVARAEMRITETRAGQLKGKLRYMPPEQVRGKGTDRRTDVYAAAVVLWEALVGRRMFSASNEAELVLKVIQGVEQSPRQVNPAVPEALDAVCMKALALDPDGRYPTAAAFAEAIESATMAAQVPVASTRRIAGFLETLEDAEGAPDASGIRWIPSAPSQGGTPSGMSLQSHSALMGGRGSSPVLIDSTSGVGPPPLPIGSSPSLVSNPGLISGPGVGSNPSLSSSYSSGSSSNEATSPAAVALLAASAQLDGPQRRSWRLPLALGGSALLVGVMVLWVATSGSAPPPAQPQGAQPTATGEAKEVGNAAGDDDPGAEDPGETNQTASDTGDDGDGKASPELSAKPTRGRAKPTPPAETKRPPSTATAEPKTPVEPPKPPPAKTTPPPTGPKSYHPDDL